MSFGRGRPRQALIKNIGGDPLGNVDRRLEDVALRRIDQPHREVLFG